MTWYPCSCGAEHDVPHCPFGAGDGNSPPSGLRETPLRAHKVGCGNALSVPVDRCACGGRDIVFEGHALASGADPRAPSVDVSAVETLIKEMRKLIAEWRRQTVKGHSNANEALAADLKLTALMSAGIAVGLEQCANELEALISSLCDRGEEGEGTKQDVSGARAYSS